TEIKFTLLLPNEGNGKFFMGGGGGFVGTVQNSAQSTVNLGYATAGTDTGHQGGAVEAGWALNNIERRVNFGYLAVHRTADVAKSIVLSYYGSASTRSYFSGCSRGGGQAMMEALRYPDDFDGVVAGAPAMDWTGIGAQFIKDAQAAFPAGASAPLPGQTAPSLRVGFGTELFKYFVFNDPAWDYTKYQFANFRKDTELTASYLNSNDPKLDAFKANNHKVIMWHGWADAGLSPLG